MKQEWNFNIDECPKGTYKTATKKIGKTEKKIKTFVPYYIWVATKHDIVTRSYITEDGERFNMLASKEKPIAWMPFVVPNHPNIEGEK